MAPRGEVPFLHEKQIAAEADLLLAEYGGEHESIVAPPVLVDEIVEFYLHLTLEYEDMKSLFPFADVHGAIWFDLAKIGIDQDLVPDTNPSRLGRYHFRLAHEVGSLTSASEALRSESCGAEPVRGRFRQTERGLPLQ